MRRWAFLAVLLAVAAVAEGQATVTVVRFTARPILIRPADVLGRKFGPFSFDEVSTTDDGPHAAMWRLLDDQLSQIASLHDRVAAAMTIRCPRLRQRALELALASAMDSAAVESQEDSDAMGTWATIADADETRSARSAVAEALLGDEDDAVDVPEWMDTRIKAEFMDEFEDNDDDEDDDDWEDEEERSVPAWGDRMHRHHEHMSDDDHERMHEWMHAHGHDHGHEHGHEHAHPDGPFPFPHHHHHHSDGMMLPRRDMQKPMTVPMGGRSEPWRGLGPTSTAVPVDDSTNWALWNEDGSLNGGLIMFAMLSAACAAVWSALLLQCAAFGWERACAAGRGQFAYSAVPWAFETSSDEEDDDPKAALKREQRAVVYAADFVGKA